MFYLQIQHILCTHSPKAFGFVIQTHCNTKCSLKEVAIASPSPIPSPQVIASCNEMCRRPRVVPTFSSHSTTLAALLLCKKDTVLYKVFLISHTHRLQKYFCVLAPLCLCSKVKCLKTWPHVTLNCLGDHPLPLSPDSHFKAFLPLLSSSFMQNALLSFSHSGPTSLTGISKTDHSSSSSHACLLHTHSPSIYPLNTP